MIVAVTVAVLVGLGLVAGAGLALADRYFGVEEDPRVDALEEALPGANCGACGYPGCRAYAKALVGGEDVDLCAPGGNATVRALAEILGREAVEVVEKVALVRCAGTATATSFKAEYAGIQDCRAADIVAAGVTACPDGCLGLGSCVEACDYGAIVIRNGVAVVLPELCIGDGKCVPACPRGLIEMVPKTRQVHVLCSNRLPARQVRQVCRVGCTGCKLCTRVDPAFVVENNVARVAGEPGDKAGEAALACPSQSILDLRLFSAEEFVSSDRARARFKELQAEYKERKKKERLAARKAGERKAEGGPEGKDRAGASRQKAEQSSHAGSDSKGGGS